MKAMNLMKVAMAVTLLFAVNMEADAQFGKLKGLVNKAKETVTVSGSSTTTTTATTTAAPASNNSSAVGSSQPTPSATPAPVQKEQKAAETPEEHERKVAEDAEYWFDYWFRQDPSPDFTKKLAAQVKQKFGAQKVAKVANIAYTVRGFGEDYVEEYVDWTSGNGMFNRAPEYDGSDIRSVSRNQYFIYYEKGGKCYVVRAENRTLEYRDGQAHGLKMGYSTAPDPNWNPGFHPEVEIPAEIYKQHFK